MIRSVHKKFKGYLLLLAAGSLSAAHLIFQRSASESLTMVSTSIVVVLMVLTVIRMTLAVSNQMYFFPGSSFFKIPKLMKQFYTVVAFILISTCTQAQFTKGGVRANFGIDADTRSGYTKYGPTLNGVTSDDWFGNGVNRGVIDTTNSAFYKSQLQANKNISFSKGMSAPIYSQSNGKLWLDGAYLRDYTSVTGRDSTSYGPSAKNGESPAKWDGAPKNVTSKVDIVDAYMHMRRDGLSVNDSLWLFTGVSTFRVDGDRYLDMEFYKNYLGYNRSTGVFTTAGISNGHTEWLFDIFGNIIQSGDMIITLTYSGDNTVEFEVRIWVNKLTTKISRSLYFDWEDFDGSHYGYVTITPKSNRSFGSAIANISNNFSKDTTWSTPWGTVSKGEIWASNYDSQQYGEVALNLTALGIDPAQYAIGNPCGTIFNSVIFKGRASHSFTANLHDFAGPIYFTPVGNGTLPTVSVQSESLNCLKTEATLAVVNNSNIGVYTWTTLNGQIANSNNDKSVINVKKSGLYTLGVGLANGCRIEKYENVYVESDTYPPVVTADVGLTPEGQIQLLGGDSLASNYMTPFGPSKGLKWEWKGPNGFSSNEQNPLINVEWAWGAYYLTVTELRNGCTASASMDMSFQAKEQDVTGQQNSETQQLTTIAPTTKGNYIWRNAANKLILVSNQQNAIAGTVMVHNVNGQLLGSKNINLAKGSNNIELPVTHSAQMKIVSFYVGKQLLLTQKVY